MFSRKTIFCRSSIILCLGENTCGKSIMDLAYKGIEEGSSIWYYKL